MNALGGAPIDGGVVAAFLSGAVGLIGAAGGVLVQMRSSSGPVVKNLTDRVSSAEEDVKNLREELDGANDHLVAARREVTRLRLILADHGIDAGGST